MDKLVNYSREETGKIILDNRHVTQPERALILLLLFASPVALVVWAIQEPHDPVVRFGYPPFALLMLAAAAALRWRYFQPATVRKLLYLAYALITLGQIGHRLLTNSDPGAAWNSLSPDALMGVPLLLSFAHLVFDIRTATRLNLLLLLIVLVTGLAALLPPALNTDPQPLLAHLHYLVLVLFLTWLLSILARHKQSLAREQERRERFELLAYQDAATGTANRRRLEEVLRIEVAAAKVDGSPLSIVFIDLDRFKAINDAHGHETGDAILRKAATLMRTSLRPGDLLGRWGGEEFVAILPGTDTLHATGVAERLRKKLEDHDFAIPNRITASLGVATLSTEESAEELFKAADSAMYLAKTGGGNRTSTLDGRSSDPPPRSAKTLRD